MRRPGSGVTSPLRTRPWPVSREVRALTPNAAPPNAEPGRSDRRRRHRRQGPDVAVVLADRAVGRELAAGGGVDDARCGPALLVLVELGGALLRLDVVGEVGAHHPVVAPRGQGAEDVVEDARVGLVEVAAT